MRSSNHKKPKILFIYNQASTFINNDLAILSNRAQVISLECKIDKHWFGFIWSMSREFFFIARNLSGCKLIYCWFADYHSLLPALFARLFSKPFFLVLGGYDVSYVRELNYGSFSKPFRGFCARYALRKATCNLPVSDNLAKEAMRRAGKITVHVLPTGYDPEKFILTGQHKKNMVITAALIQEKQTYLIKGIDRFIELARHTPEIAFVVIGIEKGFISEIENCPANLTIVPPVSQQELYKWFGSAKFYAQFSRSEGMPNALCEAMLMECIPLGTKIGGIPSVIHDHGLILEKWDPELAKVFLNKHLDDEIARKKSRESIIERFHINRRIQYLEALISDSK